MTIAVVDDHSLVRQGLNAVLTNRGAYKVSDFATATDLLKSLHAGNGFDLFVIDLELPDIDGFELICRLRSFNPEALIIVSTIHDEVWTLHKLIAHDVNAIIYKSADGDEILSAIEVIRKGNRYYCEDASRVLKMASDASIHPSPREMEVLKLIALGKTSRQIADELYISENTVEAHRKELFYKLGAINVADLIYKAIEKGYLNH